MSELSYELKPGNIACEPPEVRLGSRDLGRLMVVDRQRKCRSHSLVFALSTLLSPGDLFVINNSKRLPGILRGRTVEGGQVEVRFAGLDEDGTATCQIYPAHWIQSRSEITFGNGDRLVVTKRCAGAYPLFEVASLGQPLKEILKRCGQPITSFFSKGYWALDNYNNFYAVDEGSVESPMAGIHLTPRLFDAMRAKGIGLASVTLHSYGSWLPFLDEDIESHSVPRERFVIPEETAEAVKRTKSAGNRVVACGSTVMRTLEASAVHSGTVEAGACVTDLYITPGFEFQVVDLYFTNFHASRSSLMVLDAAFCGVSLLLASYREAAELGYLFHEFGDAILYA